LGEDSEERIGELVKGRMGEIKNKRQKTKVKRQRAKVKSEYSNID
jgi:hypothetical protein